MAAAQEPDDSVPADIRTEIPHQARVYDYWLGGCFLYTQTNANWVSSRVAGPGG
jgi:S-adenosyl methyltransferase